MEYLKFILAALALTSTAVYLSVPQEISNGAEIYKSYAEWKLKYNKNTNSEDDAYRFMVFKQNYEFVQTANAEAGRKVVGTNIFADLTNVEYQQKFLNGYKTSSEVTSEFVRDTSVEAASSVDWVQKGAVAPVQDQGQCGSCWAFGTVGGLEGIYQVKTGNLVKLSEQQLVDCNTSNFGCMGGDELQAYAYTKINGIQTEKSYGYVSGTTGKRSTCTYNAADVVFKNTGSFSVKKNSPADIEAALLQQPLSKGIAASSIYFQLYSGGIMSNAGCGTGIDHSVTMVAFNNNNSPYWTIKNSWGTGWGNKGYMNLEKGQQNNNGVCGINMDTTGATYSN